MPQHFLPCNRDQLYLLPPSIRDWVKEDSLALFLLDVVEEFDLSAFYQSYQEDGMGRAAFQPAMWAVYDRGRQRLPLRLGGMAVDLRHPQHPEVLAKRQGRETLRGTEGRIASQGSSLSPQASQ
jgi:hypothetical protein